MPQRGPCAIFVLSRSPDPEGNSAISAAHVEQYTCPPPAGLTHNPPQRSQYFNSKCASFPELPSLAFMFITPPEALTPQNANVGWLPCRG
jgi:hypothetical protein